MRTSTRIISRMTIFILSYLLVQAGLSLRLPPTIGIQCVLVGSVGLIAYFAFRWAAFLRNRRAVRRLLVLTACRSALESRRPASPVSAKPSLAT